MVFLLLGWALDCKKVSIEIAVMLVHSSESSLARSSGVQTASSCSSIEIMIGDPSS